MQESIENLIKNFIRVSKSNFNFITKWENPVVAFAKANDPLFSQLKRIIIKEHKLPNELLSNAKTVISYFLPFCESIVLSNNEGKSPSIEWAIAYVETNKLINELNLFLSSYLEKEGFNSLGIPPTHNFNNELLVSYWSHKHVAYIAGLGKFGLHKMIITEKGCCGRLGTLITSAKIKNTNRIEKESCLYFHNKTCKLCGKSIDGYNEALNRMEID